MTTWSSKETRIIPDCDTHVLSNVSVLGLPLCRSDQADRAISTG